MKHVRDQIKIFNERIKLLATTLNALAIGLVGLALLRPLTETPMTVTWADAWWSLLGLALHGVSHYILGMTVREDAAKEDPNS